VPVAEARPARVRTRALPADNSKRGGLGRAEAHVLEGLQFRALGPVDDGEEQWVEVREAGADAPLHTLLVRQGQPITFHQAGDLHTFTFTGRGLLTGQLRYRLARNDPPSSACSRSSWTPMTCTAMACWTGSGDQ